MSIARKLFVASGLTLLVSAPVYIPHAHQPSVSQRSDVGTWDTRPFDQDGRIPVDGWSAPSSEIVLSRRG